MKSRQQSQSTVGHQESVAKHHNIGALDSASTLPAPVASGERLNATNENIFQSISTCNMRIDGEALATFWMYLT